MNNIYTTNNYTLFVADDGFQYYLILEGNASYNHRIIEWGPSDTEASALGQKFRTIGLTEEDFCDNEKWKDYNFRRIYGFFYKVEPSLRVYVNDCGDIVITIHTSGFNNKYSNIWAYMDDEDAIKFLVSYTNGNGDFDMEPFEHSLGKTYFTDEEMEELVDGLDLVGENGVILDKVADWPISAVLAKAGFHYTTK